MWVLWTNRNFSHQVADGVGRTRRGGGSCSESEVSVGWGPLGIPVLYLSSTDPGQSELLPSSPAEVGDDLLGWGDDSHFYFPSESYSEVWPSRVIYLQKAANGWTNDWPNLTVRGKGKTHSLGSFYSSPGSVLGHFSCTAHHYECLSTRTLNTQPPSARSNSSWWQWMRRGFHPQ